MGRVRHFLGRDYRLVACVQCLLLQETLRYTQPRTQCEVSHIGLQVVYSLSHADHINSRRLSHKSFMNQVPGKMQCTARVGITCQSGKYKSSCPAKRNM